MTAATHDTFVFDLGGVLIDWDPRHLYRKLRRAAPSSSWFIPTDSRMIGC
jgi:hypothetical protein